MNEKSELILIDLQNQRKSMEENFACLEQRITVKFPEMMEDMKRQVKEEVQKEKEKLEENMHSNFAFLEDDLKSKMAVIDKTQLDLNDLEQYTRKNSVRLFGIKESDDEESVEKKAIEVFKESLNLDVGENRIEIAHRAGKFRQDGKVIAKKSQACADKVPVTQDQS